MSIDAIRAIRELLPRAEIVQEASPLDDDVRGAYGEGPQLADAELIEDHALRAHRVNGDPIVAFTAFLDGIQRVGIVAHEHGIPIVEGIVAAAIRERRNKRFMTSRRVVPIVMKSLYAPLRLLGIGTVERAGSFRVVDTSLTSKGLLVSRHPGALRATAFERVLRDREDLEIRLAESWCSAQGGPIFVDGGISSSEIVAKAECVVGIVKSHATLFADDGSLRIIMDLRRGERSSAFVPPSRGRSKVMSWYLRLRDPTGRDAMFGLVRIEAALCENVASRANDVSRWVLAEASPVALPDNRWDRMAYGIRDCEEFLRAIAS